MKRIISILCLLFSAVLAEENLNPGAFANLGAGLSYYRYAEPKAMNMNLFLYGLNGKIGYNFAKTWKTSLDAQLLVGSGQYKGSTLDTGSDTYKNESVVTQASAAITTLEAKLGFNTFQALGIQNHALYVQSGIGHWFAKDRDYIVPRQQQYIYVPIELEGASRLSNTWTLNYLVGYKYFVRGIHNTRTSRGPWDRDLNVKQDGDYGLRVMIGVSYDMQNVKNFLRLCFDHWQVKDSPSVPLVSEFGERANYYEPKNNTQLVNLQFGFLF